MLNNFPYQLLKFSKTIWYFHLSPYNGENYIWVDYNKLAYEEKSLINYDFRYSSRKISDLDASYQALVKGVMAQSSNKINYNDIKVFPEDIYRFNRKYFNKIWLGVILFFRLLFLNNPLKELVAIYRTRSVEKQDVFNRHCVYNGYDRYNSKLVKANQLISIIIPTLNRYSPLKNLLYDLTKQIYSNFEVIIIDQSDPFNEFFYSEIRLNLNLIKQKKPALWEARNTGIISAKSNYLLFLDDDSRVAEDWLLQHIKCLDYFNADISSGVSLSLIGAKIPDNYTFFRWSDQLDTGNVLIKRSVFKICGLFDEQFEGMRMGDGEFGVRAYLNGFKNVSNCKSYRIHLKNNTGGLREIGHWDSFRSSSIFSPLPIPSVLYFWRKYWGDKSALLNCSIILPTSLTSYKNKNNLLSIIFSLILFIIFIPFLILRFIFSWKMASKMILDGSKIYRSRLNMD
tara:strand:- start:5117 stop:6481 length:1365 start_codon:yes stop_codon:yes gene_type:complete